MRWMNFFINVASFKLFNLIQMHIIEQCLQTMLVYCKHLLNYFFYWISESSGQAQYEADRSTVNMLLVTMLLILQWRYHVWWRNLCLFGFLNIKQLLCALRFCVLYVNMAAVWNSAMKRFQWNFLLFETSCV